VTAPKILDAGLMQAASHVKGAMAASGAPLCSYLVALAAFQRGLDVSFETFLGNETDYRGSSPNFAGHYLKISDGRRTHYFDKSRGDRSKAIHTRAVASKEITKKLADYHGVSTPRGVEFRTFDNETLSKFLASSSARKFVVKPVAGSLCKGVLAGLSKDEVFEVATEQRHAFIVEEFISGREYRVFVVNDRVAAAYFRHQPRVVGDGLGTIEALIDRKNAARATNPRASTSPIDKMQVARWLEAQGRSIFDIPKAFEPITTSLVKNISSGGDGEDVTQVLPDTVRQAALGACAAVSLPTGGVDIIEDEITGCAYVLEVNARAHLGTHSFPTIGAGAGNAVADAILDYYFPSSKHNRRFPELVLDFGAVRSALASASFRSVSYIKIEKSWIHRRIPLEMSHDEADRILRQLQLVCIHVEKFSYSDFSHVINAFFLVNGFSGLLKTRALNRKPVISPVVDSFIFER
jgi:D-alanine-D-alanine ligase-like ATP-grasp enzyme